MPSPLCFLQPSGLRSLVRGACRRRRQPTCTLNSQPRNGIYVRNVSYWWKSGQIALQDVSLQVAPGELSMIVGPNGCGKSTLLKVVRGLLEPPGGEVFLEKPCAFVQQNPDIQILFPTIGSDIAASIAGVEDMTDNEAYLEVVALLGVVGLGPADDIINSSPHRLSGGQKQRAVVAAALAMKPLCLLFDEVTASMDPLSKAELVSRIREIVTQKKIAALWVTHLLDELDFADTIIIMNQGKIVAQGPRVAMMPFIYDLQDGLL